MDFKQELVHMLVKETKLDENEINTLISVPPDQKLGDYAFPCFKLGKNAKEEAEKLKEKITLPKIFSKVEVAGPYLNFYVNTSIFSEETLTKINNNYGQQNLGNGKTITIDFSAPNIAKPFGIGHLRSTVIGNCLYKVHHALGYKVIGVNHLGDWGTQFGKLVTAYKKWGDEKELEQNPIKYLLKLYVKFHEEAEKDESLIEEGRTEFKNLEEGDKEATALWETFKELSLQEFKRVYKILDVEFDSYNGEAFYNKMLNETIERVKKNIKTEMSDGALIVDLEKDKMTPLMLLKSNGTTTYHTRDLAAAFYRLKEYTPEKLVYVVGQDQKLHFRQLFKVLEMMNLEEGKFVHVDFGMIKFPEGKMSTRKGNIIFLEEVLDKAIFLAEKIIDEKNPNLKNKKETAKDVGVGAIIFADLSNDRIRNINFDWDRMLSFEGETAPYIQYTHARACSILRKVKKEFGKGVSPKVNFDAINLREELILVRSLYNFQEVLVRVAETYKPHHLANYLISLAQAFNEFYHKCPVISEMEQQMKSRLLLVDCVRQVLENGLGLLGIKAPQEM
jgi:arginyl-tRNA synthetase